MQGPASNSFLAESAKQMRHHETYKWPNSHASGGGGSDSGSGSDNGSGTAATAARTAAAAASAAALG